MYGIRRKSDHIIMESRSREPYLKVPDGCEAVEFDGEIKATGKLDGDNYTPPENVPIEEPAELIALKALDASAETGSVRTIIEFLQWGKQ